MEIHKPLSSNDFTLNFLVGNFILSKHSFSHPNKHGIREVIIKKNETGIVDEIIVDEYIVIKFKKINVRARFFMFNQNFKIKNHNNLIIEKKYK